MKRTITAIAGLTVASAFAFAGDKLEQSFDQIDANDDGLVSQTEIMEKSKDTQHDQIGQTQYDANLNELFVQADSDSDGFLNEQEFEALKNNRDDAEEAE